MSARLVVATAAARAAVTHLREAWGTLVLVIPASCCGAPAPLCYPEGGTLASEDGVAIGEIEGCTVLVDHALYRAWGEPDLLLDVEPGAAEGFSLPPGPGLRFVIRTQAAPAEGSWDR